MPRRTWSPSMIPKAGLIEAPASGGKDSLRTEPAPEPTPAPDPDGLVLTLRPYTAGWLKDAAEEAGCAAAEMAASMLDEIALDDEALERGHD